MNEDWNEEEDDQEVENDGKEMKRTYDAAVLRMQHCLSLCKAFPCTIFFSRIREPKENERYLEAPMGVVD